MKRDKEFNNILDECLERLLVKGETIEQCLASYPEQAAELEPLLQMTVAAKKALAIQPSPDFKAKARYQFHSALQEVKPRRGLPLLGWQPQWAMVVAICLVLLLAGSGTVAAAGNSMPDSPLYPVKLATEQVQLTLTPSDIGKAQLHAKLADRRVAEIVHMVNKGKARQIEKTAHRLNNHLVMIASLPLAEKGVMRTPPAPAPAPKQLEEGAMRAPPAPALAPKQLEEEEKGIPARANGRARLRTLLGRYAVNHPAALRAALKTAPESAKPALRRAIAESAAGYKRALEALD